MKKGDSELNPNRPGTLPTPAGLDRVQRKLPMRFERRSMGIEIMLPFNTGFAEVEPVFLFHSIHAVNDRVADLRLQFADKAVKGTHLDNWDKTESFQKPALAGNGIERLIENGKATIRPALPFKMMDSQFAPPSAKLVRDASVFRALAHSVFYST